MYLTLLCLPLIGGVMSGLLGRKLGREGSHLITTVCMLMSCLLGIVGYYEIGYNGAGVRIEIGDWITSETTFINWGVNIDSLSISMIVTVLVISTIVHTYSIGYMKEDPHNQRFFSYLSLFTFFMLLLLAGDNMVLIFVGWEGIHECLKWYNDESLVYSIIMIVNSSM